MKRKILFVFLIVSVLFFAFRHYYHQHVVIQAEQHFGATRYYDSSNYRTVGIIAPVVVREDFLTSRVDTVMWDTVMENSGDTPIVNTLFIDGALRLTTGGTDNDDCALVSDLRFRADKYPFLEFVIRPLDISGQAFAMGLASRTNPTADSLVCMYDGTTVITRDSSSDNFAGFVYDPDATTDYIYGISVLNGTANTVVSSAVTPTDSTVYALYMRVDSDGDVEYYVNGTFIGRTATAIQTDTLMCIYAGMINREGSANYLDIDRIWFGQQK